MHVLPAAASTDTRKSQQRAIPNYACHRNNTGLKRKEATRELVLTAYGRGKGTDTNPICHGQMCSYQELLQAPNEIRVIESQNGLCWEVP